MGAFKTAVLNTEELQSLRNDLSDQLFVRGEDAISNVIEEGPLQRKLMQVAKGTPEQKSNALKNAVRRAALSGAKGAVLSGIAQGVEGVPKGLSMAGPGAVSGYIQGKKEQQLKEIEQALPNTLVDNSISNM